MQSNITDYTHAISLSDALNANPNLENEASSILYDLFVEDIIHSIAHVAHRNQKFNTYPCLHVGSLSATNNYILASSNGEKVTGATGDSSTHAPPLKKQPECVCPCCSRNLAACRFAPHLEKCLGMGRNSSRIASRRILAAATANMERSGNGSSNHNNSYSATASSNSATNDFDNDYHNNGGSTYIPSSTAKQQRRYTKKQRTQQQNQVSTASCRENVGGATSQSLSNNVSSNDDSVNSLSAQTSVIIPNESNTISDTPQPSTKLIFRRNFQTGQLVAQHSNIAS